MRFCYYKLINDLCASLKEAANYISQSGDTSLWPVCTEAADTIKNMLEINKDSVRSDNIFTLLNELGSELTACVNGKASENIEALIDSFAEECRNNIEYKLRVLFVADLGGKWDSMDSVYHEFKKRDDCQVDVVIQPYFRQQLGEDGVTRTETICEDYLTPMGIENIPYEDYDMEKIAPDMTFISQPYESCTIPMFWPENIAKFSRLVYLPYFNAISIKKEVTTAFTSLFNLDVQKYSWKIACQSETLKHYYEMYASEKGQNVIVTGLPKCDYPFKLNRKNTPCPQKWKNKIAGKKVFLWNSHFSPDNQGIKVLEQGMEFLKIFSSNKKAALIWRPHPLTEMIIKVYLPDKLPIYKRLLKFISDSDNIVIDKNSTYDCSFVWSDALISDYSSFADQYLLLDKPIIYTSPTNHMQTKIKYSTTDELFDFSKTKWACSVNEVKKFITDICDGNDDGAADRRYLLDNYFALSDGKAGERLVSVLINDFYSENAIT